MALIRDSDTGLVLIQADWPDCPANVHAYSSTRMGGVSLAPYGDVNGDAGLNMGEHVGDSRDAVRINRDCLLDYMPKPVTFLSQIHGNIAVDLASLAADQIIEADACFTSLPNLTCVVLTADCLPLLLASVDGKCVAAVHTGWRGLVNGVIESTLKQMRQKTQAEISAWMGPAIGPNAFEVGSEVREIFSQKSHKHALNFIPNKQVEGKFFANIYGLASDVLKACDVQKISGGNFCTYTDEELFYSYRRDGVTGRMASWIWIG